jgi:hypothetical protein
MLMLRFVTVFSLLMTASFAYCESLAELCPADRDLSHLVRHTPQTHAESYDRWWKMYRIGCRSAWRCASSGDVATYLMIWSVDGLDGDLSEGVAEDTENLLIWKPTCFFEGMLRLPPRVQEQLATRFSPLVRPVLVTKVLREYQRYDRYQGLAARLEQNARVSDQEGKLDGASGADELYPPEFHACK